MENENFALGFGWIGGTRINIIRETSVNKDSGKYWKQFKLSNESKNLIEMLIQKLLIELNYNNNKIDRNKIHFEL